MVPAPFGADGIVGGAERYALELARHMADVVPTRLLTFGSKQRTEKSGALSVRVLGGGQRLRGQPNPIKWSLFSEIKSVDILHCHQQHILVSSFSAALCKLMRKRVFVTDLGGGARDVSNYVSTDRWFDGHLHISEYSREVFGHGHKPWAHVVGAGIDTRRFSPDPLATHEPVVLFVGRLLPHKGVNYLIEALPSGLRLELIGRAYDERYLGYLRSLADGTAVSFRTDCDDQMLIEAYRRSLCIVLPSVYRTVYGGETRIPELFGQSLAEGMACGIPAICTDVASMPEVVANGETGFVVPPNNPSALRERLEWVRDNPERARALGEAGRLRVLAKFTWPAVVERCLEIYRNYGSAA